MKNKKLITRLTKNKRKYTTGGISIAGILGFIISKVEPVLSLITMTDNITFFINIFWFLIYVGVPIIVLYSYFKILDLIEDVNKNVKKQNKKLNFISQKTSEITSQIIDINRENIDYSNGQLNKITRNVNDYFMELQKNIPNYSKGNGLLVNINKEVNEVSKEKIELIETKLRNISNEISKNPKK